MSVAEPSADLHASSLIRAVSALHPGVRFSGVAGPRMREAGCRAVYDMTAHSAMLTAVVGHVHHGWQMLKASRNELHSNRMDLAVMVDSPLINLRVAHQAKACGIPVLYYIAPQLWAWGARYRFERVRKRVDRLACILPFEEPYFRSYGIEAHYVGHPLFAHLSSIDPSEVKIRQIRSGHDPVVAILPGSRRHVALENFPNQYRVACALRESFPGLKVLISVANDQVRPILEAVVGSSEMPVALLEGDNAALLRAADVVLVSSGTATLEAAYHHTPMIVMYNSSRMYHLIQWIIDTPYFSLPNILARREVVPEFMPYYRSIEPIIRSARRLLLDETARQQMSRELGELVRPFLETTASETTAKIILDMIEAGRATAPSGPTSPARSPQRGQSATAGSLRQDGVRQPPDALQRPQSMKEPEPFN